MITRLLMSSSSHTSLTLDIFLILSEHSVIMILVMNFLSLGILVVLVLAVCGLCNGVVCGLWRQDCVTAVCGLDVFTTEMKSEAKLIN